MEVLLNEERHKLFHKLSSPTTLPTPFKFRTYLGINKNSKVSDEVWQCPGIAVHQEVSSEGGRKGNR